MMELVEAQGWKGLMPLPMSVYSNLVRQFNCSLEVGNLDNEQFTIDTKVKGKVYSAYTEYFVEHY